MAVGLPIGTRNIKSGIQRNPKTQPIPTGPSQTVGVARDPGVAGGPGNVPAGAFGTEGGVEFGRAIQGLSNTVIAEEQARRSALIAAQEREQAKIETVLTDNLANAYEKQIKGIDVKFNPLDTNALIKANGMYQKPFDETLKLAEGRSDFFKERLRLRLDTVRDTQLGALNNHQIVERDKMYVNQWKGRIGMITAQADGTNIMQDLMDAEDLSFDYRQGMEIAKWEEIRDGELKKVVMAHMKALRRQYPLEVPTKEYSRLLGDPLIQGIMRDDLQAEIDKMVAIEKAAATLRANDPLVRAQKEVEAVEEVWQETHPGESLPFLQEAAMLSKNFKPTPAQTLEGEQAVKLAEYEFQKKHINKRRVKNNQELLTPDQENELWMEGKFGQSPEEESAKIAKTGALKVKRVQESLKESNQPALTGPEAVNIETGFESPVAKGTAAGLADLNEIATLLGKTVEELSPEERKLKYPKGITVQGDKFETSFSKTSGENLANRFKAQGDKAREAHDSNIQLDSITAALQTHTFDPGAFPDTRIFLGTLATFVQDKSGIDMSAVIDFVGNPSTGNQIDAAGKRLLLQLAKGIGRITNLSLRFAQDAVPGLFRTREGLEMISALMKRENDINIGLGKITDQALGMEPNKARAWARDMEAAYRRNNPLFNRELQDRMLTLANKNKKKGERKLTRADMFSKAPKIKGMTMLGTEDGFHYYRNDKTKEVFKKSVHGQDPVNDPHGKTPLGDKTSATPRSGAATIADAASNITLDQVQSVASDLLQNVKPEVLQELMLGLQDLFKGGEK